MGSASVLVAYPVWGTIEGIRGLGHRLCHQETEFFGRPEHLGIRKLKNSVSGRNDDQSRIRRENGLEADALSERDGCCK